MNHFQLIELCHERAHNSEHDFEDAAFIALTRREIWLVLLCANVLCIAAPCLTNNCSDFIERLTEIIDTQKPHWRSDEAPET